MASEPLAIANPGLHRQESGLDIAKIASAYDTRPQESGTKDGSELSEENPWEKIPSLWSAIQRTVGSLLG